MIAKVARLVFVFCFALTTGRCNAFQNIFVNKKKSEFYGTYFQAMLFLVTMATFLFNVDSNLPNSLYKNFPSERSSRPEVFCKKGVLKNFTKFTGKHLCQSLFFNKVAGFRFATLLKKILRRRCFSVDFAKFLRTSFLTEHIRWLLLFGIVGKFNFFP